MNQRDIAVNYLRYFTYAGTLADNAPSALINWMSLLKSVDRYLVHDALLSLAGKPRQAHDTIYISSWFAVRPHATVHLDAVLASKKPPTSYAELLNRAFSEAQIVVNSLVRDFIKTQLPKD